MTRHKLRWWDQALRFWFGPVDPIRLDAFRVLIGLALLLYMAAWWRDAREWLTPIGFHLSAHVIPFAPVVPPLPPSLLLWFGVLFFGSLAAFILGWHATWATRIVLGCVTYVSLIDYLASYTINKLFIASFAVLAFVRLGVYWSLTPRPAQPQSAWSLRVLQATLLIQYFTAGWCKVAHGDWLKNPYVLWSQIQGIYRTEFAAWLLHVLPAGVWAWLQYTALSFELLAPVLFLVKRLRPLGWLWGFGFSLMIALTMHQLGYFMLQMVSFYVLFMDDRTLHHLWRSIANAGQGITGSRRRAAEAKTP